MSERLIEKLAADIADIIVPPVITRDGSMIVGGANPRIRNLLIEFANEVKREAIEP